jgi:ABC-type sugar transport system substrate-binding protein
MASPGKQAKVLVLLISRDQPFQQAQEADARATAARLGVAIEVLHAGTDPVTQQRQAAEALAAPEGSRPGAILIEPVAVAGIEPTARAAAQAGVGWVLLGHETPALRLVRKEFPGHPLLSVGTDNDGIGRLQARIFRALLPAGGQLLYFEGPSFSGASIHRRQLTEQGLEGSGIEFLKVLSGDWTQASAERMATIWLKIWSRGRRPDLVGAQNDDMAAGARKALLAIEPGWSGIPFVGADGLADGGQRMVREGILAATVVTPPPTGTGIELVLRALRGDPVPQTTLMPPLAHPAVEDLERRPARGAAAQAGQRPPARA